MLKVNYIGFVRNLFSEGKVEAYTKQSEKFLLRIQSRVFVIGILQNRPVDQIIAYGLR